MASIYDFEVNTISGKQVPLSDHKRQGVVGC
jgi:glutathione peroxidase-family protein